MPNNTPKDKMKTFIAIASISRGLPRTCQTGSVTKIFNAKSSDEAEKTMEEYMEKHYGPHGWEWSVGYFEVSRRRMKSLLEGRSRRVNPRIESI